MFCLVTGRFVPPIHRRNLYSMQYSMLPARRAGMSEVWAMLTQPKKSGGGAGGAGSAGGIGGSHPVPKVPPNFGQGDPRRRGHR